MSSTKNKLGRRCIYEWTLWPRRERIDDRHRNDQLNCSQWLERDSSANWRWWPCVNAHLASCSMGEVLRVVCWA